MSQSGTTYIERLCDALDDVLTRAATIGRCRLLH